MKVEYFDYPTIAKRCKISTKIVKEIEKLERKEFPRDQMMFELHMLRILRSIEKGIVKPEEILRSK